MVLYPTKLSRYRNNMNDHDLLECLESQCNLHTASTRALTNTGVFQMQDEPHIKNELRNNKKRLESTIGERLRSASGKRSTKSGNEPMSMQL